MTENQNKMTPEEIIDNLWQIGPDVFDGLPALFVTKRDVLEALEQYGSQQFTAGVEAGKREREFIPDIEEAAIHQWDMHYGMGKDEQIKPYVIEDFKAGAEWMKNRIEQESKWIPVEERYPPIDSFVLVAHDHHVTEVHYHEYTSGERMFIIEPSSEKIRGVTHWQFKPSPPNPDKGGKEKE